MDINQQTVKSNGFSKHDNRHTLENCGVYLGQGLGRRHVEESRSQHTSENHMLWEEPSVPKSTYTTTYCSRTEPLGIDHNGADPDRTLTALKLPTSLTHKFQVFSKTSFHRYPHTHKPAAGLPPAPPLSEMAKWFFHHHQAGGPSLSTSTAKEAQNPPWAWPNES